jgi:hypothetical protein
MQSMHLRRQRFLNISLTYEPSKGFCVLVRVTKRDISQVDHDREAVSKEDPEWGLGDAVVVVVLVVGRRSKIERELDGKDMRAKIWPFLQRREELNGLQPALEVHKAV